VAFFAWKPYVPVTKRCQQAALRVKKLAKKGLAVEPVIVEGRTIARTFWGKSWCENLERYSDYESRLPRGRTYVQTAGQPVISVDTKKEELVGNYKNGGSDYRPKGDPQRVNVHDFVDKELGKAVPYGASTTWQPTPDSSASGSRATRPSSPSRRSAAGSDGWGANAIQKRKS
jgi:hypothetical protein